MYILMRRSTARENWIPVLTYKELLGAQHALINLSKNNEYYWDIFVGESITKRMVEEETVEVPEIVKERTNKGAK